MNHSKTTLLLGSIVVAGALTGVALAILLKQFLEDREMDLSVIGTHGTHTVFTVKKTELKVHMVLALSVLVKLLLRMVVLLTVEYS
jgi:hypothetical protein